MRLGFVIDTIPKLETLNVSTFLKTYTSKMRGKYSAENLSTLTLCLGFRLCWASHLTHPTTRRARARWKLGRRLKSCALRTALNSQRGMKTLAKGRLQVVVALSEWSDKLFSLPPLSKVRETLSLVWRSSKLAFRNKTPRNNSNIVSISKTRLNEGVPCILW